MDVIESIILGIIQGLTEFLPVSSSGHLEIGKALLGIDIEEDLAFTVIVHFATVLSTITVFYKDIGQIISGVLKLKWNDETEYAAKLILSAIPVLIVGVLFRDEVESLFSRKRIIDGQIQESADLLIVGGALLVTATLLMLTSFIRSGKEKKVPYLDALIMGIAQAFAVVPGLSRSGSTIATGLLLKNNREEVARFSFLMVLIPIIGASLIQLLEWIQTGHTGTGILQLFAGFAAAYISGFLACKWMIGIVKRGKLIWFALYCAVVGIISIVSMF